MTKILPFGRAFIRVESFVGMLFAWFVGLAVITFVVIGWRNAAGSFAAALLATPVALFALAVEVSMFVATWQAMSDRETLAIAAAQRVRIWPVFARPVVALWWLAHFLVGVAGAVMFEFTLHDVETHRRTGTAPPSPAFVYVFGFGLTFAGNVFLALAVANVTRRESILKRVWSLRLLIDALVFLAPTILARFGFK